MRMHREVLKFACGLAENPEPLLEFVAEQARKEMQEEYIFKDRLESDDFENSMHSKLAHSVSVFLQKVWAQQQKPVSIEPLDNKFVNFVTSTTEKIHVPS